MAIKRPNECNEDTNDEQRDSLPIATGDLAVDENSGEHIAKPLRQTQQANHLGDQLALLLIGQATSGEAELLPLEKQIWEQEPDSTNQKSQEDREGYREEPDP